MWDCVKLKLLFENILYSVLIDGKYVRILDIAFKIR